jgi:ubiquinone/menaquinone biosynthesis C-methylase UbiE
LIHVREGLGQKQSLESQLAAIYSRQSELKKYDYLEAHSHNLAVVRRDTSILERLSHFIPSSGAILDWGCNHAPSSCLVRMLRGDSVQLYGCDMHRENYRAFFDFANLRYTQLNHPYLLPYDDNSFDAVIGTAALEHVPNDSESLTELYRVIKPGGVLIVTTLPNRFSYTEWLNQRLHRPHHLRIYSRKEIKRMFLHHGFVPAISGYHQAFPSMCSTGGIFESGFANKFIDAIASQNKIAETLWPIRCFASNLFVIGKKVNGIDNNDFDLQKRIGKVEI